MTHWQKYLTEVIALQNRAHNVEKELRFSRMIKELSPSQLAQKMEIAKSAKSLYTKAHRICSLLLTLEGVPVDASRICHRIAGGIRRMDDAIKILDLKAQKYGLKTEEDLEEDAPTLRSPELGDINTADVGSEDRLRDEVRGSLKALLDIVEYMERPTLLKIRKELDKLVNY